MCRWCGRFPYIWKPLPFFLNWCCYKGQGISTIWQDNTSSFLGNSPFPKFFLSILPCTLYFDFILHMILMDSKEIYVPSVKLKQHLVFVSTILFQEMHNFLIYVQIVFRSYDDAKWLLGIKQNFVSFSLMQYFVLAWSPFQGNALSQVFQIYCWEAILLKNF